MNCRYCGYSSLSPTAFCTDCGQAQNRPTAFPVNRAEPSNYAGFLQRLLAFIIDEVLAGAAALATYAVLAAIGSAFFLGGMSSRYGAGAGVGLGAGAFVLCCGGLAAMAVYILYFVKLETSSRQGTVGKGLLGIKVTDARGHTLSVGQSLGRLFIKNFFSALFFFIGFLMALFTERRQTLHDFAAGTVVVQR